MSIEQYRLETSDWVKKYILHEDGSSTWSYGRLTKYRDTYTNRIRICVSWKDFPFHTWELESNLWPLTEDELAILSLATLGERDDTNL